MQPLLIFVLLCMATLSLQQPPGVPPRQQYQPPHGHQQQQTQEGHGHGHHSQQQQPQEGHVHHEKPLEFVSEVHNAEHILEHLENVVATKSKDEMSQEELEFHYFKQHDNDNDNQLDGVEIGKALTHSHDATTEQNSTSTSGQHNKPILSDEDLAKTIDGILSTFDQDKNGYITYFEFKRMSQVPASRQQGSV